MPSEYLFEMGPDPDKAPENTWMIRPCEMYLDELKDCTSMRGRFHQKYVYGHEADCTPWNNDYENCIKWRNKQDPQAFASIIASEQARIEERIRKATDNDVMPIRNSPPADFNAPLSPEMEHKRQDSFLYKNFQPPDGVPAERVNPFKVWLSSWKVKGSEKKMSGEEFVKVFGGGAATPSAGDAAPASSANKNVQ